MFFPRPPGLQNYYRSLMELGDLPEDVVRFIVDQIDSVPHLEALLLIWENLDKRWTEDEIAARVYVERAAARTILHDLLRRKIIVASGESPVSYSYDPAWDETGQLMQKVASTYRRNIVRIATLIHSKASPGVREFARAFQFKSDQ